MKPASTLATTTIAIFVAVMATACRPIQAPPANESHAPQLPVRNELLSAVNQIAEPVLYDIPWDAAPSPAGDTVYFTAATKDGAGVFRVPAGGGDVRPLVVGAPLVAARGLVVSPDGETIYVADPDTVSGGEIFAIPVTGGAPAPLAGTRGSHPQNLDIVGTDAGVTLYYSGSDPQSGQPAVFSLALPGDTKPMLLASGAPLVQPDGLAVTTSGVVYVADRSGQVLRIAEGAATPILSGVRTGNPAGATMTTDEAVLLVSALAPEKESARVLVIDLTSGDAAIITKMIENNQGSGGVHRAYSTNFFAWADSSSGSGGSRGGRGGGVYGLNP